jgi:tRNA (guanine10-N2)-dimethyltransferase
MQYFFILGNNPTLSFAEIASVFNLKPEQVLTLTEETLIVNLAEEIDARQIIRKLGGTIKVGIINFQFSIFNFQTIFNDSIFKLINTNNVKGKFNFGISYYGKGKFKQEKELAMEIKKALKEKGVSSRWVTSREKTLSSVVVEQNKLVGERGVEIIIIGNGDNYFVGRTLAVQPFKELSARDYGRPGRDDYSGMLPPKLAQILINLSGVKFDNILLDPFCGSGTIITEAALMGFQNLVGCDISEKAVDNTKQNVKFLMSNFKSISNDVMSNFKLFVCDAKKLSQQIKPNFVDAIVTEPCLGPSRMQRNEKNIRQVASELESLYRQAIMEFAKILKFNGRVVMVWPVFKLAELEVFLNSDRILNNSSLKIINPLSGFNNNTLRLTKRNTIVYGRENQKVWREVVILKK